MFRRYHKRGQFRHWARRASHHNSFDGHGRWSRHFRHHRRRFCLKAVVFFIVVALALAIGHRCARKRIHKRVKALLEIENRTFRAKYGVEWKTNCRVTQLSLVSVNRPAVQLMSYPSPQQVMTNQPVFNTPFEEAPVVQEENLRSGRIHRGYQRVSLDDSAIGYSYR